VPIFVIAGIPSPVFNRNKGYKIEIEDWVIESIPSRAPKQGNLGTCWDEVMEFARRNMADGVHIVAFHPKQSDHSIFARRLKDQYRMVWVDEETIRMYGTKAFTTVIERLIHFEEKWRAELKPQGLSDPHLLPEPSFKPLNCETLWGRIRNIHVESGDLEKVVTLKAEFRKNHYHRGYWRDARDLCFQVAPERHGGFFETSKFTFVVPVGFHYNVNDVRGRRFTVNDWTGTPHKFRDYTNVDCHGGIRGGR